MLHRTAIALILSMLLQSCRSISPKEDKNSAITPFRSAEVSQWDRGYIRFHGSWVGEDGRELSGEPITLECLRGRGCTEVRVPVAGNAAYIDHHYEISSWDQAEILLKPIPEQCGEFSARISRFPIAVHGTFRASSTTGFCKGPLEDHLLLRVD